MLIKFHTIGQIEHGEYPFVKAVADNDVINGTFGTVVGGKFTASADASSAIMQVEAGDDMCLDQYLISKKSPLRIIDFMKVNGQPMEFYGQLPVGIAVGDKLKSDANGKLVTGATTAPYFEVTDIIGNYAGVEVKVITSEPSDQQSV